jgi:ATP-dependent Clp protease ATP-binding subunit ClpA
MSDGFTATASRAIGVATDEAKALGHGQVGTEHLLLGVLSCGDDDAALALASAGATLAAVRHKVDEAVGGRSPSQGTPPMTARASRALERAVRFSHQHRAGAVDCTHVLLGVLDVEGTAGQVLRGVGVDVKALRATLDGRTDPAPAPDEDDAVAPLTCPACGAALELRYEMVEATGPLGPIEALAWGCARCGRALGAAPT